MTPGSSPVPFFIAFSTLSLGIFASLAFAKAKRSLGFIFGSPPPSFAATVISLVTLVNSLPLTASAAAFLFFVVFHFECPDILGNASDLAWFLNTKLYHFGR